MLLYAIAVDHEHPIAMSLPVQGKIVHDQCRPTWSLRKPSWTSQSGETCSTDSTRSVATLQKWSHGEHAVGLAGEHIEWQIYGWSQVAENIAIGAHTSWVFWITVGNSKLAHQAPARHQEDYDATNGTSLESGQAPAKTVEIWPRNCKKFLNGITCVLNSSTHYIEGFENCETSPGDFIRKWSGSNKVFSPNPQDVESAQKSGRPPVAFGKKGSFLYISSK